MRAARVNPFHPRQQNNIAGQAGEAGLEGVVRRDVPAALQYTWRLQLRYNQI
jgi:hypothetical protein